MSPCGAGQQSNMMRGRGTKRVPTLGIAGRQFGNTCWVVVALCLHGTLGGCAHYEAAPLDPKAAAANFAARGLNQPGLRDDVARLIPQAAGAVAAAAMGSRPASGGRAGAKSAARHRSGAGRCGIIPQDYRRRSANPDLILQSEYARHDAHPWLYGVSLNWLLRSADRRRLDVEMAQLDIRGARLQVMDQAWAVRRALAAALTDWESARRRLILVDRLALEQDELLRVQQRRIAAGEDAPALLIASQQDRIQIEREQSQIHEAAEAAQAAAAKALGLPPQALDGVSLEWPEWGTPPPLDDEARREAGERALLSRADFAAAVAEYAMAENKLKRSIARQYPQFVLEPGYYWDHGIAKFPFDVGFTLPFNGNRG